MTDLYKVGSAILDKSLAVAPAVSPTIKRIYISDLHISDGSPADDFNKNTRLAYHILQHYYKDGWACILSEGLELLEARFSDIWNKCGSRNILRQLRRIVEYWIPGNHSLKAEKYLAEVMPGIKFAPAVKVQDKGIVFHGHEFDWWNHKPRRIVKFVVRYIWPCLQRFGACSEPPYETSSREDKISPINNLYMRYGREKQTNIIVGHTHKPMLVMVNKTHHYINTGSWVGYGIVVAEQDAHSITLVRWHPDEHREIIGFTHW